MADRLRMTDKDRETLVYLRLSASRDGAVRRSAAMIRNTRRFSIFSREVRAPGGCEYCSSSPPPTSTAVVRASGRNGNAARHGALRTEHDVAPSVARMPPPTRPRPAGRDQTPRDANILRPGFAPREDERRNENPRPLRNAPPPFTFTTTTVERIAFDVRSILHYHPRSGSRSRAIRASPDPDRRLRHYYSPKTTSRAAFTRRPAC